MSANWRNCLERFSGLACEALVRRIGVKTRPASGAAKLGGSEEMSTDVMSLGSRAGRLGALAADPVDVLVVGGGIVGAGVARDAAMRGLSTLLVDRYDFAFGTSSRSSRLLH